MEKNLKDEIVKIVESLVGRFACPKYIIFVEDLPRTRTGKLVRRVIRQKHWEKILVIKIYQLLRIQNH